MRNILLSIDNSKQTEEAVLFLLNHIYNPSLHQLHLLHVIPQPSSQHYHCTNTLRPPDTIPTPPKTYYKDDNGNNNSNDTNPAMTAAQSIVQHRAVDIIHRHHQFLLSKTASKTSSSSFSLSTPTSSPPPPLCHPPITHIITIRNTHGLHLHGGAGDLVGDVIVNMAGQLDALMVVMAKYNKSMLQQVFTRSCTTYCTRHCRSPILVYTSS